MRRRYDSELGFLGEAVCGKRGNLAGLLLAKSLAAAGSVFYAFLLRDLINAAAAGEREGFFFSFLMLIALACFQIFLSAVIRFLEERMRSGLENRLKGRLFGVILRKDYFSVAAVHSEEWMNRLTSDTAVVANGMTEILPGAAGMAVRIVGATAMIIVLEPRLFYFVAPGGAALVALSYGFRRIMKRLHRDVQEQDGRLRVFLQESLGSLLVIRSFAVEGNIVRDAEKKMERHMQARMRRSNFSNLCSVGFGIAMRGAYVLGAFFCGYGILVGRVDYGTFMAVLQLIGQLQAPFANISGYLPRFYAMLASADRLMEAERLADGRTIEAYTPAGARELYRSSFEALGVDRVFCAYPARSFSERQDGLSGEKGREPVLAGLTLEIRKGEFIGLTGTSGCGKSTLLKVLMCLLPVDSGERYVVLGGQREILDPKWQRLFAYVPQGNYLMSGTLREIVAFSDQDGKEDEERVRQALSIACADDFVYGMAQGVDTVLGERGMGLSEGQLQRIAIARAIFSGRPILMLDECTSALDEPTERQLLVNLRAMTDRTVLIVTHRRAVLEICDKVVGFSGRGRAERGMED